MKTLNEMVAEYGSPWSFYRAVYKETACGPTIGMLFEGADDFVYTDNLPRDEDTRVIRLISVSSIVEGSDVEVDPRKVDTVERFWQALEDVNDEARFYGNRDNSIFIVLNADGNDAIFCELCAEDDSYWSSDGNDDLAEAAIERFFDDYKTIEVNGIPYRITEDLPDYTY